MRQRDKAIIKDLERFRVMTRDDIATLYFGNLNSPRTSANYVLKRLRRDGYIEADTNTRPFMYFPKPTTVKKGSSKISHFLKIVECYKEMRKIGGIKQFEVEPKFGDKGTIEPDIFTIWQNAPFFIEVQNSLTYSNKNMRDKLERYKAYKRSELWKELSWQVYGKEVFPTVLIITDKNYDTSFVNDFKVYQAKIISNFYHRFFPKKKVIKWDLSNSAI
ncbi:helix-turn-helix domain-containing protein [Tuberibacillus sp. Marseille-P3662]|uniref:helix-turn-helix domain-containing protein n=1 Tax=Tuberibacillus sp. Marseille-P3662 TaxID=1965358 RepID=UPI000A1C8604|nr:helix-turn-helix domain-containing protein [Tuberibacillus sp. Marseille-P3662]